jgi:5-methylcytosine-specific restriction endonuclease McrA
VLKETREKIRNTLKGRKLSLETKRKMSKSHKGINTWTKGKHLSEKTIEKLKAKKNTDKGKKSCSKAGKLGATNRWKGHIKTIREVKGKRETKNTHDKNLQLEKKRFTNMRYKARKIEAEGSHTFGEWEHLKKQYGYICPMCGKNEPDIKLTEDHIIPLSKGGSDNIENIQPLCVACNTRKHTKTIKFDPIDNSLNQGEKGA